MRQIDPPLPTLFIGFPSQRNEKERKTKERNQEKIRERERENGKGKGKKRKEKKRKEKETTPTSCTARVAVHSVYGAVSGENLLLETEMRAVPSKPLLAGSNGR
jgi:hypothetical protein